MRVHLTLLADAAQELAEAFRQYQRLSAAKRIPVVSYTAGRAFRSCYVGIEKALKHALLLENPYLLVERLDARMVLALTKDTVTHPAPNILLSRVPFETPSLIRSWELCRQLKCDGMDEGDLDAFERSLKRFCELRHKAQHGELAGERDELTAILEQVLVGVRTVLGKVSPDFYRRLCHLNGQFDSRVRALQERIDGAWTVLLDYLRNHSLEFAVDMYTTLDGEQRTTDVLLQKSQDKHHVDFVMVPRVPSDLATGLFGRMLEPDDARARMLQRERQAIMASTQRRKGTAERINKDGKGSASTDGRLPPLESGSLTIQRTSTYLTLRLPGTRPARVSLRAWVLNFAVEFPDPDDPAGVVSGLLLGPLDEQRQEYPALVLGGRAAIVSEFAVSPEMAGDEYPQGVTLRKVRLNMALTEH